MITVANESTTLTWSPDQRVVGVRYARDAVLKQRDGDFLADTLAGWLGDSTAPFGVLADADGLAGTDAAYRARAHQFFKQRRDHAFIALTNLGPVIHVVVELFRLGTGVQLKTFGNEADARAWLRTHGVPA
jgi:hypothetical protein